MKVCPFCGAELESDAAFCHHCMHPLTEKKTLTPYRHRSRRAVFLALAAVLTIVLVITAVMMYPRPGPGLPAAPQTTAVTSTTTERSLQETTAVTDPTTTATDERTTAVTTTVTTAATTTSETKPLVKPTATTKRTTTTTTTTKTPTTTTAYTPFLLRETDGGVEIIGVGLVPSDGKCIIPSVIGGQPVVRIADYAFKNNDTLTSVTIPASVTSIGLNAFTNCSNLSSVYIRATSIDIHTYAFSTHYQRDVALTIYAPASALDARTAQIYWDADYVEWNG